MLTKKTDKIQWYNIRRIGETRWTAYELTDGQYERLQSCYESTGPHKSLIICLIKANS